MQDTGLGTTYERWSLNRLLDSLCSRLAIGSALEGPDDGITGISGINSLILARRQIRVTVCLYDVERIALARRVWEAQGCDRLVTFVELSAPRLPAEPNSYDLVWNFNVMPRVPHPGRLLDEMIAASRRYVLLFVPNRANYSFWLHRLHHRVADEAWDHGPVNLLAAEPWAEMLRQRGLIVRQKLLVDVCWWPDIIDPARMLADMVPALARRVRMPSSEKRYRWGYDDLPYYDARAYSAVHRRMERLAFIERLPWDGLRRRFAHHVGVLAEKTNGSRRI